MTAPGARYPAYVSCVKSARKVVRETRATAAVFSYREGGSTHSTQRVVSSIVNTIPDTPTPRGRCDVTAKTTTTCPEHKGKGYYYVAGLIEGCRGSAAVPMLSTWGCAEVACRGMRRMAAWEGLWEVLKICEFGAV